MFKISDILKKYKKDKDKIHSFDTKGAPELRKDAENEGLMISPALSKELKKTSSLDATQGYDLALSKARELYRLDFEYKPGFLAGIGAVVESIVDLLNEDSTGLLHFCLIDYPRIEDYIFYHVVNVCIISVDLATGLGYERSRLIELGTAAFLHDIGIIKYLNLVNKKEILNMQEYNKIKQHPRDGFEILSKIDQEPIPAFIINTVLREHERLDGSGYPEGLKGDQIPEYAKIIGLVDKYEAMMHPRPYRKKYTPLEAIKEITDSKSAFEPKMIKALIGQLGIFPIGTMVRLNTKEAAMVVKINIESPLRPTVNIIYDVNGAELKEQKRVDLSKNPVLYIEDCLNCWTESPSAG